MKQTKKTLWTYSAPRATELRLHTEQFCASGNLQQSMDEDALFDENFN